MERKGPHTIETLPPSTLLHYIKKDDLEKSISPAALAQIRAQAAATGKRATAKYVKAAILAQDPGFVDTLRNSQLGLAAYQKYADNYARITSDQVRAKSQQVRSQMSTPRKGFMGCIATKVDPRTIKECVNTYDDPQYQSISLVPSAALKQSVYNKTGSDVMRPTSAHISDLPRGLKAYIRQNPLQYMDYLDELRAQTEYLKSLGHGVRGEQRYEASQGTKKRAVVGEGEAPDGWAYGVAQRDAAEYL